MKIVKTFEDWSSQSFGFQYNPYNDKIEEDLNGLLVEVMDMGIDIKISWIGIKGFILDFSSNKGFDTELLVEYVLTVEDYINDKYENLYLFEYKLSPMRKEDEYYCQLIRGAKKLEVGILVNNLTMSVMRS